MNRGNHAPGDLSPRNAAQRFLNARRPERADSTIQSYWGRLKLWIEWCEGHGIHRIGDLERWDFDDYKNQRSGEGVSSSTLNNEFDTLHQFVKYLELELDAVEDGLAEAVGEMIPGIPDGEATSDTLLEPRDALAQLRHYRRSPQRGSLNHAWLELMWHTGARMGGLRSLDLQDYRPGEAYVEFVHRPSTGTRLKKGLDGERPVAIPREVTRVLDHYISEHRWEKHDEYGRAPLFTSTRGRPADSGSAMRNWTYMATYPCTRGPCPHGKDPESCEYLDYQQCSGCPSTRSPHQVITGSITWQRDIGFPPEVVAERTNKSLATIEKYYDKASKRERLERRRRPYVDRMNLDDLGTQTGENQES